MINFLEILEYNKSSEFSTNFIELPSLILEDLPLNTSLNNFLSVTLLFSLTYLKIPKIDYGTYSGEFIDIIKKAKGFAIKELFQDSEKAKIFGEISEKLHDREKLFFFNFKAFNSIGNPLKEIFRDIEKEFIETYYKQLNSINSKNLNSVKVLLAKNNFHSVLPIFIINREGTIFFIKDEYLDPKKTEQKNIINLNGIIDCFLEKLDKTSKPEIEQKSPNTELQVSILSSLNKNNLIDLNNEKIELLNKRRQESIDLINKNIDAQIEEISKQNELLFLSYSEYLRSSHWKNIRKRLLEDKNNTCEKCNKQFLSQKLSVHHLHYSSVGKEKASDVMLLCIQCHSKESSILI